MTSRWHHPRPAPKGSRAMVNFLMGRGKNADPGAVAGELGVSRRTVRDWLTGKREPSKANRAKLADATSSRWEKKARETARKHGEPYVRGGGGGAAGGGEGGEGAPAPLTRMRYNGQVRMLGQSGRNYARGRSIVHPMTPDQGARAALAYQNGDAEQLNQVGAEVLAAYFNTGGGYNFGPEDIDYDVSGADFE